MFSSHNKDAVKCIDKNKIINDISINTNINIKIINKVIGSFNSHLIESFKSDIDIIEIPKLGHFNKTNRGRITNIIKLKNAESIERTGNSLNDNQVKDIVQQSKEEIYNRLCNKLNRIDILDNSNIVKESLRNSFKNINKI
jgi:nucleoid DNA-binding protein